MMTDHQKLHRDLDSSFPILERKPGTRPKTMEDASLTRYLLRAIAELRSASTSPPPCPYCISSDTVYYHWNPKGQVPIFHCHACLRWFRRATGTPMHRIKLRDPEALVALLSQQIPAEVAADRLGVKPLTVSNQVRRFRKWLLILDPTGYWESKIRLGLVPMPDVRCLICGKSEFMRYRGFRKKTTRTERMLYCLACHSYCGTGRAEAAGVVVAGQLETPPRPPSKHRKSNKCV
jgi:transposase-like protein